MLSLLLFYESRNPDLNRNKLKTGFQKDLVGDIFNDFERCILACSEEWNSPDCELAAPIGILCPSSGYGKTKMCYQFAQRHVTKFLCMNKLMETG